MNKYPKEQIYNKLVRDKIPSIIEANGAIPETKVVTKKEVIELLKEKVLEEGKELLEANEIEDLKIKMSDVLELLHSLAEELGVSMEELEYIRQERAEKRGRF